MPRFLDMISADARTDIESVGIPRHFQPRSNLFMVGEPAGTVFVVERGLVRIERTTSNGRRVLINLNPSGSVIGDLAAIDGSPRSASAVAIEPTDCLLLTSSDFMQLFSRHSDVALAVTRLITERMRSLTGQFIEATERSATARVASRLVALLDLADRTDPPIELRLPISQEELGQWAGLSREGTAKALRELREDGVLTTGRNRMTILDPQYLRTLSAGLA